MPAPCPECRLELMALDDRMAGCPRCGGVWLDNGATQALDAGRLDPRALAAVASLERSASSSSGESPYRAGASAAATRACPVCEAPLTPAGTHGMEPIELDICADHGTFLDRAELLSIARRRARDKAVLDEIAAQEMLDELHEAQLRAASAGGRYSILPLLLSLFGPREP